MFRNQLLRSLPDHDVRSLTERLETVEIKPGQVLERANAAIEHVYFPESGIASVVMLDRDGRRMEAGPFGWDGMSGLPLVTEVGTSPNETLVQIAGVAARLPAAALSALLRTSPSLRRRLLRYVHAFAVQTGHTALAAGLAVVEQRLARWLLMLHDRIDGDELQLTHEFMALMLAVRRPGVTVALHELEGRGLIRSRRNLVIVRDRAGLQELCGGIYGVPEAEYRRVILNAPAEEDDAPA